MMEVYTKGVVAAPEQRVIEPNGHFVWLSHQDDSGLGFGMGSTQGVFNSYKRRGFLRPELPNVDRAARRSFNLRGYRGAREKWACGWPYACHYDPEPFFQEKPPVWTRHVDEVPVQMKQMKETQQHNMKSSSQIQFIALALVIVGAVVFARRR